MNVADSEIQWIKELPSTHRSYLVSLEADATDASKSGKPFFDFPFQPRRGTLSTVVSFMAILGWEYVTSVPGDRDYPILLFKKL